MNVYRIHDCGEFWDWAAESPDRARELHVQANYIDAGIPPGDFEPDPGTSVMRLPDDKMICVKDAGPDGEPVKKTAAEWAAEGEGCIGTTCV